MIEYIYIVKCPNCEDEHFHFFDEAKTCAMGYISKKPVITQVEVTRNDFGECTDSCDLGTVWSWEEAMKDTEDGYTEAEPTKAIFTKDDLKRMASGEDPEFDDIDNSVDFEPETSEISAIDEVPDNFKKPISENASKYGGFRTDGYRTALACYDTDDFDINVEFGMQDEEEYEVEDYPYLLKPGQTVADLVVYLSRECGFTNIYVYFERSATRADIKSIAGFETVPGNHDYRHYGTIEDRLVEKCNKQDRKPIPEGMTIEQLVEEMEENEDTVECTWCNDLFDKSECRKEVNLGWLCSRCEAAIKSRGESLTFKENNYWDFLDEDAELKEASLTDIMASVNREHGTNYTEHDILDAEGIDDGEFFNDLDTGIEIFHDAQKQKHARQAYAIRKAIADREAKATHDLGNEYDGGYPAEDVEVELTEAEEPAKKFDPNEEVEFDYEDLSFEYDLETITKDYTYRTTKWEVADTLWAEGLITEEDAADVPGGLEALEDNEVWESFLDTHFDALLDKYYDELKELFKEYATSELENNFDWLEYEEGQRADYGDYLDHARRDDF